MTFKFAKTLAASLAFFCIAGLSSAQTYRQNFPLPDGASLNGISINVNTVTLTDAQLDQIKAAGIKYIRYDLTWQGIEMTRGVYFWSGTDSFMNRCQARGIRVMAMIGFSNTLYSATGAPNTDDSRAGYAAFSAAAVNRYKGRGIVWEIYNEPNLSGWWANPNPNDYAALVATAVPAMRAVAPDEWIVGLSTTMYGPTTRDYVDAALSAGVLNYLDGVSIHPYTHDYPEILNSNWASLRLAIEAKRPAGRTISLIAGEAGFSRAWEGVTPAIQSTMALRTIFTDLTLGIGLTNIFNYEDMSSGQDWHMAMGITSAGANVPYPVYNALKRTTEALGSYKFTKRLTVGSADDYVLLFSNPNDANDCKLVVWTSAASHTASVPSSPGSFTTVALTSGTTGTATALTGLTVNLGADPVVYAATTSNPLLAIAGSWAKAPASVTLSTKADAIVQLGDLLVSPAWASAPVGTTLKVEDLPTNVPGYVRPSYTTTLTNLSTLMISGSTIQNLFSQLGGLQDESEWARTLRFTLQLPDGTSTTQVTTVLRKQPMRVFVTTPQSYQLTLRVENPSAQFFRGTLKARSGAVSATQTIEFNAGETYKMLFFPTLTTTLLSKELVFELYDTSGNVVDTGAPVVQSKPLTVFRLPQLVTGSGFVATIAGTPSVSGTVAMLFGNAAWEFLTGAASSDINYTFGNGAWKAISLNAPSSVTNFKYYKEPVSMGMWVKGDDSKNFIRAQFIDASNQTFQVTYGGIGWTGWRWVNFPLAGNWNMHWGGANDGIVHLPIRCVTPFILDSNQVATAGTVSITGITIVGQK